MFIRHLQNEILSRSGLELLQMPLFSARIVQLLAVTSSLYFLYFLFEI